MQRHRNNIGIIRLILASLVIISHAFPQIDGNNAREPLFRLTGTTTLGQLAVGGFFLVSGYLITMSWDRSRSTGDYLVRRILRIWPAYFVCALLCTFVLSPAVGGTPLSQPASAYLWMVALTGPVASPGQLAGLPIPDLNGSMWTISIEFLCYLAVIALGITGVLKSRVVLLCVFALVAAVTLLGEDPSVAAHIASLKHGLLTYWLTGPPMALVLFFMSGAVAYQWRDTLARRISPAIAWASFALACASLFSARLATLGLATVGGLWLYWLCFEAELGKLQAINDRWDISYGTYLYGWPIAIFALYTHPSLQPWQVIAIALPLSWLAGAASWWGIEKAAKDLFKNGSAISRVRPLTTSPEADRHEIR